MKLLFQYQYRSVLLAAVVSSLSLPVIAKDQPTAEAAIPTPAPATVVTASGTKRPDPKRFEKEIAKFDAQYAEKPVKGGIVFTGSSSIRLWKTDTAFPDLPVLNRGFGGSVANDLIVYADKVVFRHEPKLLVVYTGSNDLNAKLTVEETFKDYTTFLNMVHEKLPQCRVIVNPVKVAESRIKQIPSVTKLNGLLEAWCKKNASWVRWIDSTSYLVDAEGKPKSEFYRKDKLHLNDEGYAKWNAIIEPVLKEEWARVGPK